MRRLIVLAVLVAMFAAAGCEQPAPPPTDEARVLAMQLPAAVRQNVPFDVDIYAADLGTNNYDVTYPVDTPPPAALKTLLITCTGVLSNVGPDSPACEYDDEETTTMSITKTQYRFVWTGDRGTTIPFKVCASSEINGSQGCVTKTITVES